jgi:hypothetical protein
MSKPSPLLGLKHSIELSPADSERQRQRKLPTFEAETNIFGLVDERDEHEIDDEGRKVFSSSVSPNTSD